MWRTRNLLVTLILLSIIKPAVARTFSGSLNVFIIFITIAIISASIGLGYRLWKSSNRPHAPSQFLFPPQNVISRPGLAQFRFNPVPVAYNQQFALGPQLYHVQYLHHRPQNIERGISNMQIQNEQFNPSGTQMLNQQNNQLIQNGDRVQPFNPKLSQNSTEFYTFPPHISHFQNLDVAQYSLNGQQHHHLHHPNSQQLPFGFSQPGSSGLQAIPTVESVGYSDYPAANLVNPTSPANPGYVVPRSAPLSIEPLLDVCWNRPSSTEDKPPNYSFLFPINPKPKPKPGPSS